MLSPFGPVQNVVLVLGGNQHEAGDLCCELSYLDTAKVLFADLAGQHWLATTQVDLSLNLAQFFVRDNQGVAGAAGRIEHPDAPEKIAQVKQCSWIGTRDLSSFRQPTS